MSQALLFTSTLHAHRRTADGLTFIASLAPFVCEIVTTTPPINDKPQLPQLRPNCPQLSVRGLRLEAWGSLFRVQVLGLRLRVW